MAVYVQEPYTFSAWLRDQIFMGMTMKDYLRSLITPFNIGIGLFLLFIGIPICVMRFALGLGATTNLSNTNPWGIWIAVDVMSGVGLAAGGFVMATAVHIFRMKKYEPILRPAILTGFLGYLFFAIGLLFDIGRPWRLPYPLLVSYGTASILFLIAWHAALYLTTQLVEFSPAIFEWLRWKTFRKWANRVTIGATIFGAILSVLHQSALGGLMLLAPSKVHPLWYSEYIPVFFLMSAVGAAVSMVIIESSLSHRFIPKATDPHHAVDLNEIYFGLSKAAATILYAYFGMKWIGVAHTNNWALLNTPMGHWFMVEVMVFILLPCLLFTGAVRDRHLGMARTAAAITVVGVILNRINVSLVALNWNVQDRYFPSWMEIVITITLISIGILTFRWIVNRLPVLREHPEY
jgi:Ni/Fe-hydrogenase subunit HybB-like protein